MPHFDCITTSEEETEALGESIAPYLSPGTVVALYGELASGKTCLTRGIVRHFYGDASVHSPTFTLVNEYGVPEKTVYHLDVYRLCEAEELLHLGYEDFVEGSGICVIEWADRVRALLPSKRLDVFLEHGGGDKRRLRFVNYCIDQGLWEAWVQDRQAEGLGAP
ncbi:MAG: tRNA (adenosine(37)-N6)-threonylcarbamoyltransferase complex ATPase subunit type 1 TsaE [Candidatus Hydrogenedentes bacterium]|jgi:tRNA threonylcarbamoyladenosine biosynthesis protein TsaE|nr:tRNA (adenosine(37)-N6)-threonylcarbamoyltransferase complex ATPase subunit type 1 TsaE [Candidatus Hydrogenedentota bacterium]